MTSTTAGSAPVATTEVRMLEGPNLYFTRPALKLGLALPGYAALGATEAAALAARLGLPAARPGSAHTPQRQRFVMRLVVQVVRLVAEQAGVRRLAVHTRATDDLHRIVVAVPWSRRTRAQALGAVLVDVLTRLLDSPGDADVELARAGAAVRAGGPAAPAAVVTPSVPVVAVTGTNGKTTTTRMLAHLAMTAGLRTAWSSTDGVVVMGEVVRPGDYSGPAGAREVLSTPGLQLGILETARGGLLLKGMGVSQVDVTVVTNVAADHLGLHDIDTLDQLAEVKAIPVRVVRPDGWLVLNGDDPRVWAMRSRSRARVFATSLDPESPALREAMAAGGRALTVLGHDIVLLTAGADPEPVLPVLDVPMTLAGIASINIANALGAISAALALGLPMSAVVAGARSFQPDPVDNSGRFNVHSLPLPGGGQGTVVVDMAHNEAGLRALLEVSRRLAPPGAQVLLALGGSGDRTDEALVGMGELAGVGADVVVVAHKPKYLRGRSPAQLEGLFETGLHRVGAAARAAYPREADALAALRAQCGPGDVVALMCHDQRPEVFDLLHEWGASSDDAATIRRKVLRAAGASPDAVQLADVELGRPGPAPAPRAQPAGSGAGAGPAGSKSGS